jgi:hypothetical protein
MSPTPMAKADFLTSLVFFVLGLYMIVEGLGMPGAGGFIEAGGEPGRVPVLLGAIIAIFAIVLLLRSVAQGGYRLRDGENLDPEEVRGYRRTAVTAIGCSFYAVGLLGSSVAGWAVPYAGATFLFIFLFIVGFEWEFAPEIGARRWAWFYGKWPSASEAVAGLLAPLRGHRAPYAWLIFVSLVQSVLVTAAVTYLFEQQFYVRLP